MGHHHDTLRQGMTPMCGTDSAPNHEEAGRRLIGAAADGRADPDASWD